MAEADIRRQMSMNTVDNVDQLIKPIQWYDETVVQPVKNKLSDYGIKFDETSRLLDQSAQEYANEDQWGKAVPLSLLSSGTQMVGDVVADPMTYALPMATQLAKGASKLAKGLSASYPMAGKALPTSNITRDMISGEARSATVQQLKNLEDGIAGTASNLDVGTIAKVLDANALRANEALRKGQESLRKAMLSGDEYKVAQWDKFNKHYEDVINGIDQDYNKILELDPSKSVMTPTEFNSFFSDLSDASKEAIKVELNAPANMAGDIATSQTMMPNINEARRTNVYNAGEPLSFEQRMAMPTKYPWLEPSANKASELYNTRQQISQWNTTPKYAHELANIGDIQYGNAPMTPLNVLGSPMRDDKK